LISKSKGALVDFAMLGVGFREALHLEHLGDILPIDEDIGHEAVVDILAVRRRWKKSSVMLSLVTQQVLLSANPVVPELLGIRVDAEATSP
jgi:hypothetical protein